MLKANDWEFVGCTGSHHHFEHPIRLGKVTVPHPKKDLTIRTLKSIERQSGLKLI